MKTIKAFKAAAGLVLAAVLTSCNSSFLQGMAAGLGSIGGYSPYSAGSMGTSVPAYTGGTAGTMPFPATSFTFDALSEGYTVPVAGGGTVDVSTSGSTFSGSSGSSSSGGACPLCHGSGRIVKDFNVATYGTDSREKCSECGQWFMRSTGHRHVTCTQCHGTGRM